MNEPAVLPSDSKQGRVVFIMAVILLIAAALVIGYIAFQKPRGVDVDLIVKSDRLTPAQRDLETVLVATYREYRTNSSWWSLAYYGCVFVSAFLSAMSALILKLTSFPSREDLKKDVAALFATVAALLITLSTVGSFQQKWEANRLAATAVQNLVYEVWKSDSPDKSDISSKMEHINLLRNQEIVGGTQEKPTGSEKQPPPNSPGGTNTPGKTPPPETSKTPATGASTASKTSRTQIDQSKPK
jgi:hypothetical protein